MPRVMDARVERSVVPLRDGVVRSILQAESRRGGFAPPGVRR
jgi:hypothetical protein